MIRSLLRSLRAFGLLFLAAAASLPLIPTEPAAAQSRVALVIGNNAYVRVQPLSNAVNDAAVVAQELKKNGFETVTLFDAKIADINAAKRKFVAAVANGGVGVFYFSGHGLQVEGRNFLLPVDFANATEAGFVNESLSVPALLDDLDRAKARLSIVILDACRDNPFSTQAAKSATRGLSEVARAIPSGTLVLYAASSNQAALDSVPNQKSKHGLFTNELLAVMRESRLEIRELAQRVRYSVMEKAQSAGHLQIPALYDNLTPGSFYLSSTGVSGPTAATPASSAKMPRQIKLIIPTAAGGPSDQVVRAMVPFLAKALGSEITVENQIDLLGDKLGQVIAASPKDGSVLLVSPFTASARRVQTQDERTAPIGILADTTLSIVASQNTRATSLPELLVQARSTGRKLRLVHGDAPGSALMVCAQQFRAKFGAALVDLVPVKGDAIAVQDILAGNADLACVNTSSARPHVQGGKMRELAEISSSSAASLQKRRVESAAAQGFDIIAPNWLGLYGPAGMNAGITQQLSAAIAKIQTDPAFIQALARLNALPGSPDQSTPDGLVRSVRLALSLQR